MAILNLSLFDDHVKAELDKLPRSTTIKQFVTEAICEKLGITAPEPLKRGAPAREK